jgi:predicted nucleotide-binding protein
MTIHKPCDSEKLLYNVKIALDDIHKKRLSLIQSSCLKSTNSIFVIHGHDELNLMRLQGFLKNDLSLPVVILSQKDNIGRTIIEKFEEEALDCQYAFALFSPDDTTNNEYYQARPNAIFELGWFYSKIGRKRVCILQQETVKIHSDLDGIARIMYKDSILEKTNEIVRELKAVGVIPA